MAGKSAIVGSYTDVEMKRLEWLWPHRFPIGKISLLVGVQGKGKSFLSIYMAAQVSTGRPWGDCPGQTREPGSVIILTAEDDPSDTVKPRLAAAGADMSRVYRIRGFKEEGSDTTKGMYNLTHDKDVLYDALKRIPDVKLVIVDPISSYMRGRDENKNAEVRSFLMPLAVLAEEFKLAMVGIHHLNKNETASIEHRVMGSTGFTAAARAVWLVELDRLDDERRLLLWVKGNLAGKTWGLAYRLHPTPVQKSDGVVEEEHYCAFEADPVKLTARDVLNGMPGSPGRPRKQETAAEWLEGYLGDGEKPAMDVFRDGEAEGFSEKTIRRAKKTLKVQSVRVPGTDDPIGGQWMWSLPPNGDTLG